MKDNWNFWNFQNPLSFLGCCAWNLAGVLKIPLGKLAPYILGVGLWKNGKRVQKEDGE